MAFDFNLFSDGYLSRGRARSGSAGSGGISGKVETKYKKRDPDYRSEEDMVSRLITNNPYIDGETKAKLSLQYAGLFPGESGDGGGSGTAIVYPTRVDMKSRRHELLMHLEREQARRERREPAFPDVKGAMSFISFGKRDRG